MLALSPNQRIVFNVLISYARSIFALICGLLAGRWTLMALGEVDYGLSGLIGGMVIFITFLNTLLAGAIGRFYAYAIGEAQSNPEQGLINCQKWFNSALLIHTTIPIVLILIGYPLGEYAILKWLTIPTSRVSDCIWVWKIVCSSCFLNMVTIPFTSFYYARQYFGEITLYTTIGIFLNVLVLFYMASTPRNWLVYSVLWTSLLSTVPNLLLTIRSKWIFQECRFNWKYLWSAQRTKALFNYAGWTMFGGMGAMAKNQLIAILINKYFGPSVNAAISIGNQVSGKVSIFSSGISMAFQPAIINACGAGDYERMKNLAYLTCKLGTLMTLVLLLPICLELPGIIKLWLGHPPLYTTGFCWCILITLFIDQITVGHLLAVNANGKIALYQAVLGSILILTFPIAWGLIALGIGALSAGYALIITMLFCTIGRVVFARFLVGMSIKFWLSKIVKPILLLIFLIGSMGILLQLAIKPSLIRIILTSCITEIFFCILSWILVLNQEERVLVRTKFLERIKLKLK